MDHIPHDANEHAAHRHVHGHAPRPAVAATADSLLRASAAVRLAAAGVAIAAIWAAAFLVIG